MLVKMPGLEKIPENLNNDITRQKKKNKRKKSNSERNRRKRCCSSSCKLMWCVQRFAEIWESYKYPLVYHFCFFFHVKLKLIKNSENN